MFRTAELGRTISKEDYKAIAPALRNELIGLQADLRTAGFPVILVFAGVDGAGKNQTVNLINDWLDPRGIVTRAYSTPSDEERERPEFWRFWRDLPPRGSIGLFLRSWYSRPVLESAYGQIDVAGLNAQLDRIVAFESELAKDGALVLKVWLHLSQDAQKKRLKKLQDDPHESWRVTETDWKHYKMYDRFIRAGESTILRTSTGDARWSIVEGQHRRYREITVLTLLRDALVRHMGQQARRRQMRLADREAAAADTGPDTGGDTPARVTVPAHASVLHGLDMGLTLDQDSYDAALAKATARLSHLHRKAKAKGITTILVFEGWDAAGKGGAIRRLIAPLDARDYQVISIAAPTDEERNQHYLWRFWRHLPRAGRVAIFDRSWYGRVLVERVEEFADDEEWRRAYGEINDFESQLIDFGMVLLKFWLHITPEEQLARFEQRRALPYKQWKLTDEDWRNREKWPLYEAAVNDMVQQTSTHISPWVLIEGNCKRHARVKAIQAFTAALGAALDRKRGKR